MHDPRADCEGVKTFPQECLHQRINDQIVDIPVSSIAEVPGVPCATPVGPQIGDLGFDMDGRSCEIILIGGRSWHTRGQVRVLNSWEKRGRHESGQWITRQRLHCMRARCQAQEALTVDGVRVGYRRPRAGYKYRAQIQVHDLTESSSTRAYELAEIESRLENFEVALQGNVLAEYIIHMCTKPMSCCLSARPSLKGRLASSTMWSRWLLRFGMDLWIYLFYELPDRNIITSSLMFQLR